MSSKETTIEERIKYCLDNFKTTTENPKHILEKIEELGLIQLWRMVRIMGGCKLLKELQDSVKNGIYVAFDIRAITKGEYERQPAFNKVKIRRRYNCQITKFDDEMEAREDILRQIILKTIEGSPNKPVGGSEDKNED